VTTVISQGSVAPRLWCGGQCDSQFVANFLANSTMEKFRKSVNICQSYGQKYRGPFFDSQCSIVTLRFEDVSFPAAPTFRYRKSAHVFPVFRVQEIRINEISYCTRTDVCPNRISKRYVGNESSHVS